MTTKAPILVNRRSGQRFTVDLAIRDHRLIADEPGDVGGDDLGPTPVELLSASLAACTAMTIEMYARRKEWPLEDVSVEITHERIREPLPDDPSRTHEFEQFHQLITLNGDLDAEQRQRLLTIAGRCPVHRILSGTPRMIEELVAAREK